METSSAQAGLMTAAQLRQLGLAPSTVAGRSRAGGMWTRVLPSVHLITGGNPTHLQQEVAALLYCGEGSAVTGLSALRHHGLTLRPDDSGEWLVHVLVPHERRVASKGFVLAERTRRMPTTTPSRTHPPLPLATPARAVADAARHFRDEGAVHTLVAEAVRRGLVPVDDLLDELHAAPRQGSAHLRRALSHAGVGAWSAPEVDLQALLATSSLPAPMLNRRLFTSGGQLIAVPDAWFDDVGLALEVDSDRHHAFGRDLERTIRRNSNYARAGILCLPIAPRDIRDRPDAVLHTVKDAYRSAARSPRPNVLVADVQVPMSPPSTPTRWAG